MRISNIELKIIPDSRGDDTLETEFFFGGFSAVASVPAGKSKGSGEVATIDPKKALEKFKEVKEKIDGYNYETIEDFDNFLLSLDGTDDKHNLGGNLILVLSIGFTKLLAKSENMELYDYIAKQTGTALGKFPLMFYNLIEGGVHAKGGLPFQEYLYVPQTNSPGESLVTVGHILKLLESEIKDKYGQIKYGDEGGFDVSSDDPLEGLRLLKMTQGQTSTLAAFALDIAASTFCKDNVYKIDGKDYGHSELIEFYKQIVKEYPVMSIEDPFSEGDWDGFAEITRELNGSAWVVGDDLTTTNPSKVQEAHQKKAINAVIVKPNQIGSVSETIKAAKLAQSYGWKVIVSHRSGETNDTFIADLAVGVGAAGLKAGCPLQEERLVKYQRLVEIERKVMP